jgi:hypothetical protein
VNKVEVAQLDAAAERSGYGALFRSTARVEIFSFSLHHINLCTHV